jgi:hypothetical protein
MTNPDAEQTGTSAQMLEKVCSACGISKPIAEFPIWKKRGHLKPYAKCRDCRNSAYRTPEAREVVNTQRAANHGLESRKRAERNHARVRYEKFPEKNRASRLVRFAIMDGTLKRPCACESCLVVPKPHRDGRSAIQAHHDDYSKPLDVRWLCHGCHIKQHQGKLS